MSAPGSCKTNCLSLHCRQISEVKNELDGQPSSLLARMHVSNYKVTFFPIHLVFLELDIDQPYLDFKILDENKNEVIPRTFYLQLLNWSIFYWWNWSSWTNCQTNETIQYNHRYCRHRPNCINSGYWRNFYHSFCQCCLIACWYCLEWN